MSILTEDRVVEAVASFLRAEGYTILGTCGVKQRGFDIDAVKDEARLIVEAKGEGATNPTSRERFTRNQCRQSLEAALYKLSSLYEGGSLLALALPETDHYREALERIQPTLTRLNVTTFWVRSDGSVIWDQRDQRPQGALPPAPKQSDGLSVLKIIGFIFLAAIGTTLVRAVSNALDDTPDEAHVDVRTVGVVETPVELSPSPVLQPEISDLVRKYNTDARP
jgi:hypothetical protein